MARYFFHLHDDADAFDEEGEELPDLSAVHNHAIEDAREMAALSLVEHGRINRHHRIEVADESGQVVHVVEFGDVLNVEG